MNAGTSELTDAALVQRALGDDPDAFGHLYRRFYPRLVRLVVRKTGDRGLAEDVAQEALLRALDKLETFDRTRPLWPWLKVIATNLAVDVGRKRSREVEWDPEDTARVAAAELPSCEDGMVLAQVLASLPDRQRVAVSLRYLQDWESSEAASFLGLSIPAFEQLLFRARKRARLEYSRIAQGALGAIGLPGRWLHREAARLAARFPGARRSIESLSQMGPVTWAQAAAGGLALLAVVPSLPDGSVVRRPDAVVAQAGPRGDAARSSQRTAATAAAASGAASHSENASGPAAVPPPAGASGGSRQGLGDDLPDPKDVTDPTRDVRRPEDATILSTAWAPAAPRGERAFAVGDSHCGVGTCAPVLFTTADGGHTWKRLPARGFSGHTLVIPPGSDGTKLFAMGPAGLQVSTDGGRTFEMAALTGAAPLTGSVAVSPAFDRGDPTMLIGAQTLLRYDDSRATIQPEPSTTLNGPFEPVFSPDYPEHDRFLMGGLRVEKGRVQSTVFSCSQAMCTWMRLHGGAGTPKVRLRPDFAESDVAYAFTDNRLFLSSDVWGFTKVEVPWPGQSRLRDLQLHGRGETLFAAVHAVGVTGGEGLYRSDDGGVSWAEVSSPLFVEGAASISIHGRRMLVALPEAGLVCSADGGRHWSRRC